MVVTLAARGLVKRQLRMLAESGRAAVGAARVAVNRRIPQTSGYHDFADKRAFFGIENFLDVTSNVAFLVVGIWGLFVVTSNKFQASPFARSESWPYIVFFLGLALTFLGSSYYHLQPTNFRLMWDRLPMTLGFMGILSATIAERISLNTGVWLLPPLVLTGVLSVSYWYWTETRGKGDLRPYYAVQFGSLLAVVVILTIFPSRYTRSWCLVFALILYAAAKVAEAFDLEIYRATRLVSGHTLKHLAAAAAGFFIVLMLQGRTALGVEVKESGTLQSSSSSEPTLLTASRGKQHPLKKSVDPPRAGTLDKVLSVAENDVVPPVTSRLKGLLVRGMTRSTLIDPRAWSV